MEKNIIHKVMKPWGHEEIWALTDKYCAKFLFIKRGHRLSRQFHEVKDETIYVLQGQLRLELGHENDLETFILKPGDKYHVTPLTVHRFCASEDNDVTLAEVSTTELNDVVRVHDDYNRTS